MKIRITDIPAHGLTLSDEIALEPLNQRLSDGGNQGIEFLTAPVLAVTVTGTTDGAVTKGTVSTRYRQPCAACNKGLERELVIPLDLVIRPQPEHSNIELEDDIGVVYFEGEHIDLEDVIQESLILALSIYWRPACDAKGACTLCHLTFAQLHEINTEETGKPKGISLADLLKKAGVN